MILRKLSQYTFALSLIIPANQILAQRPVSLKAPQFSDADILGANAGLRPYRKGGIRLEKEQIQDARIYHNYGHGGAGASLAYGSAKHMVEEFIRDRNPEGPIAVLGSGYMGLITANLLADKGYQVTVFAELFPVDQLQIHKLCLTSLIAGGLWLPFGVDVQNKTLFGEITKSSFDFYKDAIEQNRFQGLKFAKGYEMGGRPDYSELPEGTLEEAEEVQIEFGNGKYFKAYEFTTILLDGYVFLNELYRDAKSKGVEFVERRFSKIEDVLALDEKLLFNCLGLGSKALFQDDHMTGIRGHHIYLKPQAEVDYFLFSPKTTGRPVSLYPSQYKIASGFSYEKGEEDAVVSADKIAESKRNLREFFKDKVAGVKDEL